MIESSALGVIGLAAFTGPVAINTLTGNWRGATAAWVQIHNRTTAPTNGVVPMMTIPVAAVGAFAFPQFENGGLVCSAGCWVGFSTTEATYTAVDGLGANIGNIFVEVDDYETPYTGTSSATGSGSDTLSVWGSGPKRLVQLTVTIGSGASAVYPLIFADGAFTQLVQCLNAHRYISSAYDRRVQPGETKVWKFGSDGMDVSSVSSAGVLSNSCMIRLSASPTIATSPASVTGNVITALYR